jgi:hypothetical protein
VIAAPPLFVGAAKESEIDWFPGVATALLTAPGVVAGVPTAEAIDAVPEPTAFIARSFIVYSVPFVKPVMVTGEEMPAEVAAQVRPPLSEYS